MNVKFLYPPPHQLVLFLYNPLNLISRTAEKVRRRTFGSKRDKITA
jgi:hypothetical protein